MHTFPVLCICNIQGQQQTNHTGVHITTLRKIWDKHLYKTGVYNTYSKLVCTTDMYNGGCNVCDKYTGFWKYCYVHVCHRQA